MKYRYTRKELFKRLVNLAYVDNSDFKVDLFATKKTKKAKNSGGVKSGKTTKKCMLCGLVFSLKRWDFCPRCNHCTLEPYCKCEDCRNYEGDLPIDRV